MYSDELARFLAVERGVEDVPEPLTFVEIADGVSLYPPEQDDPDAALAAAGFVIESG